MKSKMIPKTTTSVIYILTLMATAGMLFASIPVDISGVSYDDEKMQELTRNSVEVPRIDSLEYVAIGPSTFADIISPLIDWKTRKGVKAMYFTLDGENGIENVSAGRDIQEKVRNYIRELWRTNSDVKWVLLVGDGEIIPPRRTFVNGSSENGADENDNYVMSDLYYAGLAVDSGWERDNGWDTDNDGIFGEEDEDNSDLDFKAEVYVGRFPASNRKELRIMVERQLSYEKDPPPGSWTSSSLLSGSLMDAPNNKELFDPYKDNAYELILKVEEGLPEEVTSFKLLDYPRLEWGGYNRMFDNLNATSYTDHFEMGYSTALLACHGDLNGNCTDYKGDGGGKYPYWADYDVYFNYTTAETISNGRRTPLVYISNCDALNFTESDDTNMERLMRNPDGGAIGVIGASVTTYRGEYRDETSWGNWWLAQKFFDLLYYQTSSPGEALYLLKEEHIYHVSQRDLQPFEERMYYIDNLAYNLLGDPEGPIWTDEPRTLDVDYPEVYYQDNNRFMVTLKDEETGEPIRNARVTLMDPENEEVYFVARTGQDGKSEILFRPDTLNDLKMTVTSEGYIPFTTDVEVDSLINLVMVDELILEPEIPVYGIPLNIIAKVVNAGDIALDDVIVTIELSSGEGSQRPDKRIFHIEPGEEVVVDDLSFTPYHGINHINASVEILSDALESRTDDNRVEMDILVNEPVRFIGSLPNVQVLEDTRLSALGNMINLSNYIFDPDNNYPASPSFEINSLEPNLTWELGPGGELDIISGNDWFGVGFIEVHVTDGSVVVTRDLKVTVEPVPDPPSFEKWPGSVNGSENRPLSFQIVLEDVDSGEINLSAPGMEDISFSKIEDNSSSEMRYNVTMIPGEEDVGTSVLTIIATDSHGETAEVRIAMEISTTNDPPEVIHPDTVRVKENDRITIALDIFDPDNDQEIHVGAVGPVVGSYSYSDGILVIYPASDLDAGSEYVIDVFVDDLGTGGNRTFQITIKVEDRDREPIYATFIVIIIVLVIILATYGIIIRMQESRQRKMLDKVGDEAMMSKTARKRNERRKRPKNEPIEVPPAPAVLVGDISRKENEETSKEDDGPAAYKDLESELDEVIDEIFSPGRGGNP